VTNYSLMILYDICTYTFRKNHEMIHCITRYVHLGRGRVIIKNKWSKNYIILKKNIVFTPHFLIVMVVEYQDVLNGVYLQ